jgi:hypothetical protein
MELESAPNEEYVSRAAMPYFAVLLSGLLTTAATLAGVYWLGRNTEDFHIMGWYANYIIPAGAMIVGIAAASGYAVTSWLTGTRISRGLLLAVLLLQTGAYVTAEYIEYCDVMDGLRQRGLMQGPEPSFLQYYDFKARNFAWKKRGPGNQPGQPLGAWGYVFVLLGAVGFCLSGLLAPALLYSVPYCAPCQRYMKTKLLGVLPASVPVKKISKSNPEAQEAHAEEQEQAAAQAGEALTRLWVALAEGGTDTFQQELLAAGPIKANEKLPKRVRVSLAWCNRCEEGRIIATLVSGSGKTLQLAKLAEHPAPATFVRGILTE